MLTFLWYAYALVFMFVQCPGCLLSNVLLGTLPYRFRVKINVSIKKENLADSALKRAIFLKVKNQFSQAPTSHFQNSPLQ